MEPEQRGTRLTRPLRQTLLRQRAHHHDHQPCFLAAVACKRAIRECIISLRASSTCVIALSSAKYKRPPPGPLFPPLLLQNPHLLLSLTHPHAHTLSLPNQPTNPFNMNSELENKAGHSAATKVGGKRVPAADHPVPVVRKEYERKLPAEEETENNEDERDLERQDRFEYEKQTRLAAGERLARMQENHPKNEIHNNYKQKENIHVQQPILHTHTKSGAAAQN